MQIDINTDSSVIFIYGKKLIFEDANIKTILGEPDRIEKIKRKHIMHFHYIDPNDENGLRKGYSKTYETKDECLIYDKYGLAFCSDLGWLYQSEPQFIIFLNNKRKIDSNDSQILSKLKVKHQYSGIITVNGEIVPIDKPLIEKSSPSAAATFSLFHIPFAYLSPGMNHIGSFDTSPNIEIYLKDKKEQTASVLVVLRPHKND